MILGLAMCVLYSKNILGFLGGQLKDNLNGFNELREQHELVCTLHSNR